MRSKRDIRKTLLTSLLRSPHPIHGKQFREAIDSLLPGQDGFEEFLASESEQERFQFAKHLVQRLVYHHSYAPPTRLLRSLSDLQEAENDVVKPNQYVPQDHFEHLIHLYLLGTLLFSYSAPLHNSVLNQINKAKRRAAKARRFEGEMPDRYETFGLVWSAFVLYHDLAYPFERLRPEKRTDHPCLKPFANIARGVRKDLAIEAIANIIAVHSLLIDEETPSGENLFSLYLQSESKLVISDGKDHWALKAGATLGRETGGRTAFSIEWPKDSLPSDGKSIKGKRAKVESFWDKVALQCEQSIHIPRVDGARCLALVMTALQGGRLCALLENGASGEPIIIVSLNFEDPWVIRFHGEFSQTAYKDLFRAATACQPLEKRQIWRYFVANPVQAIERTVAHLFPRNLSEKGKEVAESDKNSLWMLFETARRHIQNLPDFKKQAVCSSDCSHELGYLARYKLGEIRGYNETPLPVFEELELLDAGYTKATDSFYDIVSRSIRENLVQNLEPDKIYEWLLEGASEASSHVCASLIEALKGTKGKISPLVNVIAESLDREATESANVEHSVRGIVQHLADRVLCPLLETTSPADPFGDVVFDEKLNLAACLNRIDNKAAAGSSIKDLDPMIPGASVEELAGSYAPEWNLTPKGPFKKDNWIDHGMAGAQILNSVLSYHRRCIDFLENPPLEKDVASIRRDQCLQTLRLAFRLHSQSDICWAQCELDIISEIVPSAIFLHNIYPSQISKSKAKQYRTGLRKNSFAYLAILADSLQVWDRRKLVNESGSELSDFITGSRFGLEVSGDTVRLHPISDDPRLRKALERLVSSLDSYLQNASALVRI